MRAECETLISKRKFAVSFAGARFGLRRWLAVQFIALALTLGAVSSVTIED